MATSYSDDQSIILPSDGSTTNNGNISLKVQPNILKQYNSFVPIISLKATNTTNYNVLIESQQYDPAKWDVICKSGGVGPNKAMGFDTNTNQPGTTAYFSNDLYIDDISIVTICGMNQENRGSNATNIEFTITEPYGMDFLEQLFDYCTTGLGEHNYLQIPYLLEIKFVGYKDDGSVETAQATKIIPIHLAQIDIKLNNSGSIYKITAFAYNELANTEQFGRVPSTFEFNSGDIINSSGSKRGNLLSSYTNGFANVLYNQQQSLLTSSPTTPAQIEIADNYHIVFSDFSQVGDGGIGTSTLIDEVWSDSNTPPIAKDSPMGINNFSLQSIGQNTLQYSVDKQTGQTPAGAVNYSTGTKISFTAGSSILDCLNTLVINSTYITKQIDSYNSIVQQINLAASGNPNASANADIQQMVATLHSTPFNWFIIVPTVKILGYDHIRNTHALDITYTIKPYTIYNIKSNNAFNGDPSPRLAKQYDYIFTGKNTEILSFDIGFTSAYLTYNQFNDNTKVQGTGGVMPDNSNGQITPATSKAPQNINVLQTTPTALNSAMITAPAPASNKEQRSVGQISSARNQAADIASTIYAPAELLQLDMTIQGDPDLIKQDGLFLNTVSDPNNPYLQNGVLSYNTGEVYAIVNFKTPQDLDLNTGLISVTYVSDNNLKKSKQNIFSGYYRIFEVNNKFSKSHFTQQINLVKFIDKNQNVSKETKNASLVTPNVNPPANPGLVPAATNPTLNSRFFTTITSSK